VVDKITRIRDTMRKLHKVTLSIGIATYPKDGLSYMELYKNADSAMYSVKRNGQDGYGFFIDTCQL
jgi:diguanylate cyclase (GGDEF)-like protein